MSINEKGPEMPKITYCISGDPTMEHHFQTLLNAIQELGETVTLAVVLNVLKTDRLFTVEESTELAKQLAKEMGITSVDIICLETQEKVGKCFRESKIIVRREEEGLDSNSEYIQKAAQTYNAPGLPAKIKWIKSDCDSNNTSGRLKRLVYQSLCETDPIVSEEFRQKALKIAPEFLIEAIEKKMKENPDKFFLPLAIEEKMKSVSSEVVNILSRDDREEQPAEATCPL